MNEMLTQILIYWLKIWVQYLILYFSSVPSNIESIRDQNVTEGDNLSLTCTASGMPQPKVSWIKPGGQRQYGHMLEFTNINRSRAGEYKCEASNECGNGTEMATIDVQCKYMWKLFIVTSCFFFALCHSIPICFSITLLMERLVYS